MSRHISDRDHGAQSANRLKNYLRIERNSKPSSASLAVQRKMRNRDKMARLKAYWAIEKQANI